MKILFRSALFLAAFAGRAALAQTPECPKTDTATAVSLVAKF